MLSFYTETEARVLQSLSNICIGKQEVDDVQAAAKKLASRTSLLAIQTGDTTVPALTVATPITSDDEDSDSVWNDMPPPLHSLMRDVSVKYSVQSEISDGADVQSSLPGDMEQRVLRPNFTHLNASYWSEKNNRPYMEDRILLDRIGTTDSTPKSVKGSLDMSALLDKLNKVSDTVDGRPRQGRRSAQTDSSSSSSTRQIISVYGVFDGHGGALASQYCTDWFSSYLLGQQSFNDLPRALTSTFKTIDKDFLSTGKEDGTTACACVVVGGKRVVCANAGDSRAIIVKRDGSVVRLSRDHKPELPEEKTRITELGGRIIMCAGRGRVQG